MSACQTPNVLSALAIISTNISATVLYYVTSIKSWRNSRVRNFIFARFSDPTPTPTSRTRPHDNLYVASGTFLTKAERRVNRVTACQHSITSGFNAVI
ncbi:hypothetical protein C8Q74DRAFT_763599 [Fomes fomentarius]|nr:hypothetical protein C8Q74DRAFT_763599 [Fomes fomentarius]